MSTGLSEVRNGRRIRAGRWSRNGNSWPWKLEPDWSSVGKALYAQYRCPDISLAKAKCTRTHKPVKNWLYQNCILVDFNDLPDHDNPGCREITTDATLSILLRHICKYTLINPLPCLAMVCRSIFHNLLQCEQRSSHQGCHKLNSSVSLR